MNNSTNIISEIRILKQKINTHIFVLEKFFSNKIFCNNCNVKDIKKYYDIFFEDLNILIELLEFLQAKIYSKQNFTREEIKFLVLKHKFLVRYMNRIIVWFKLFSYHFENDTFEKEYSIVKKFYKLFFEELKVLDYYLKLTLKKFIMFDKNKNVTFSYKTEIFFSRKKFNLLLKNILFSLEEFFFFLSSLEEKIVVLKQEYEERKLFEKKVSYKELLGFLKEEFPIIFWNEKIVKKFEKEYNNMNLQERKKLFELLYSFKNNRFDLNLPFVRKYSSKKGTIIELGHRKDVVRILFLHNIRINDKLIFIAWFKVKHHDIYEKFLQGLLEGKIAA